MKRRRRRILRPSTVALAATGVAFLVAVIGAAAFADLLAQHPPDRAVGAPYQSPTAAHWLGTDDLGRDLWSQLVHGARVTLLVGLVAAALATALGTLAALVAGWWGGLRDTAIMRLVDLVLSLPLLVLVLVLAAYFGRGQAVLILLIAGVLWARPARLLRAQVLKLREIGHVVAADALGAGPGRILRTHLLRRLVPLLSSQFVRAALIAVVVQSGVAFLGLGDPGQVSWGSMLYFANNGSAILTDAWLWWIIPPGMALTVLIVGLAFVGLALEEVADPQLVTHGHAPPVRRRLDPIEPEPPPAHVALELRGLSVAFGGARVVRSADLRVQRGRILGLVGESGSGKSTLALAVMGLLARPGRVTAGAVMFEGRDLRRLGREGLRRLRGRSIAIVPQAAMSLLNPTMRVITQVTECAAVTPAARGEAGPDDIRTGAIETDNVHPDDVEASDAEPDDIRVELTERAHAALDRVGIPRDRHRAYPHELSGGQRQRVVLAMAILNRPRLLIADEPTTGLDVVTQWEILDLLDELRAEFRFDVLLISHDLPLVATRADDLAIMYAGRIVERGATRSVLERPLHPYTRRLIDAVGTVTGPRRRPKPIEGEPPDPRRLPEGCAFAPRCPHRSAICTAEDPQLRPVDGATVACHHAPLEVSTRSNTGGGTWSDVGGDTGGGSERGTGRGAPSGTGTDDHPGTHTEATS